METTQGSALRTSGFEGLWSALCANEFRPDAEPRFLAEAPALQLTASGILYTPSLRGVHVSTPGEALVEVLLADARDGCEPAARFGRCLVAHASNSSESLENNQANRYYVTPSNALEAALMETSGERRRRKLETLCRERGIEVVAEAAQKSAVYLDQIINRRLLPPKKSDGTRSARQLGDKVARAIELGLGLGVGWFDLDDLVTPPVARLNQLQEILLSTFAKFDTDEGRLEALSRMSALAERRRSGPPSASVSEALNALKPDRNVRKSLVKPKVPNPLKRKPKE